LLALFLGNGGAAYAAISCKRGRNAVILAERETRVQPGLPVKERDHWVVVVLSKVSVALIVLLGALIWPFVQIEPGVHVPVKFEIYTRHLAAAQSWKKVIITVIVAL
jgi:hypothetical protein